MVCSFGFLDARLWIELVYWYLFKIRKLSVKNKVFFHCSAMSDLNYLLFYFENVTEASLSDE